MKIRCETFFNKKRVSGLTVNPFFSLLIIIKRFKLLFKVPTLLEIDIDKLHPSQTNIYYNHSKSFKLNNGKLPYVFIINGKYILSDGHHTIYKYKLRGIKKIKCNVI